MKIGIILAIFAFTAATAAHAQEWIGIDSQTAGFFAVDQRNSEWCWAASIQFVLNYYGIRVSQEQVVLQSHGNLRNQPGTNSEIEAFLNGRAFDARGVRSVSCKKVEHRPSHQVIINEMEKKRPLMIGYHPAPGVGHAVVITAVHIALGRDGEFIDSLVFRDPYPTPQNIRALGRVEIRGYRQVQDFLDRVSVYWMVKVEP